MTVVDTAGPDGPAAPGPADPGSAAPGSAGPASAECTEEVCVTCADQATVVEVVARDRQDPGMATVLAGGATERVDVSLVPGCGPGDLVLVHGGVAIAAVPAAAVPQDGEAR